MSAIRQRTISNEREVSKPRDQSSIESFRESEVADPPSTPPTIVQKGENFTQNADPSKPQPAQFDKLASCVAYSFCSISMILGNKFIASAAGVSTTSHGLSVLPVAFQNFCSLFFLEVLRGSNVVSYKRKLDYKQLQLVLPLSLSFVGMLLSGYMCLKFLNVPMVTIFKNATNLLIVGGEWYFYDEDISLGVFLSIFLMVVGVVAAAANDISFTFEGMCWAVVNCSTTAGYVLYMRRLTSSKAVEMTRFGTVFMNNSASFVFLILIALRTGELQRAAAVEIDPNYILVSAFTGLIGFALNFAQLWCVASTSATTYAIVGTLNKVPIAFLGIIIFKAYLTNQGYFFVAVNFVGCACYSYCKMTEPKKQLSKAVSGDEKPVSTASEPQHLSRRNKSMSTSMA